MAASRSTKQRKQWDEEAPNVNMPVNAPAVKEEVLPQYEEYLILLQERNRLLKQLRRKNKKQVQQERKEKGFSVYLNGANNTPAVRVKTASGSDSRNPAVCRLQSLQKAGGEPEEKRRVHTAPSSRRRRNWNHQSLEISTAQGSKRLPAPGNLSGKYEDDFEAYSSEEDAGGSEDWAVSDSVTSSASCVDSPRRQKVSYLKRRAAQHKDNVLTLSMQQVHKLRQSLQNNAGIRQSMCLDVTSDEWISDQDLEEIEEDVEPATDVHNTPPLFAPGDTIVLEFAPPAVRKGKVQRSLAAVRKPEADGCGSSRIKLSPSTPTAVASSRRSNSAKAPGGGSDSAADAGAVISAMQQENQQVELYVKKATGGNGSSRPLPVPKSSSLKPEKRVEDSDPMAPIVQRVLAMPPRQQRDLVKTLSHIDDSVCDVRSSQPALTKPSQSSPQGQESVQVRIAVLSNWGHPCLVGLTELQLLDQSGSLLPVHTSHVSAPAAPQSAPPAVLFNGKAKTVKGSNMWTAGWSGVPLELSVHLTCRPAALRVWNYNAAITKLNVGVRGLRVFLDKEKVFEGELEKGCGNHVFDYSQTIQLTDSTPSRSKLNTSVDCKSSRPQNTNSSSVSGTSAVVKATPPANFHKDSCVVKGGKPPHNPLPANSASLSERGLTSPLKGGSSGGSEGHHHTFRSISRSSASSASSSGSHPSRPPSQNEDLQPRSQTTVLNPRAASTKNCLDSGRSSPEVVTSDVKIPEKKKSRTPRVTKRMAANLDGRSWDTDSSKSNAESFEQKPPLPPDKSVLKSGEKMAGSRSQDKLFSPRSQQKSEASNQRQSSPSQQGGAGRTENSLVEQLKTMGSKEAARKKDVPRWLPHSEAEDTRPGLSEASGRDRSTPSTQDDIESLLDEEFASFSKLQKGTSSSSPRNPAEANEADDEVSPMQHIQKKRSRWRTKKTEDLEDTWGSLSFFNKSQRGRLSLDMADDVLDEYLSPADKPESLSQLPLPDDGFPEPNQLRDEDFVIPELPRGKELVIDIHSTWGDKHYVGLTSIQIFASTGEQVKVKKIWADPPDINVLAEYKRDPRVVSNLLDGVNRTRDDTHMWLTPFSAGQHHYIYLTLNQTHSIALLRIWNYNKSRIHSYRGAKDVTMTLDGRVIFQGEIARACGGTEGGTEAFGDTILFSTDEAILERVSQHDAAFEGDMWSDDEDDLPFQRPSTADTQPEDRPFTRAAGLLKKEEKTDTPPSTPDNHMISLAGDVLVYKTHKLEVNLVSTWGDMHYLGLTALEVVGGEGERVPVTLSMLSARPRDITHLKGHERDDRTLDKLIDGVSVTASDEHMWLIPFTAGQSHLLTFTFPQETLVSGLRVWNYNKSPEDTYRGARIMHVSINDRVVSPPEGYLVRKGPGNCHFDFAQEISFTPASPTQEAQQNSNDGDSMQMPCGFIYQMQLFSTWGDPYYLGLNGLEFYDAAFNKIVLTESNISAYPDSVNVLDQSQQDVRTPDKLIDGHNDTSDGRHMWLAPILPAVLNRVYVIFDQPTTVSMIKIWNYMKTPIRGVKDLAWLVDDLLVYNGTIRAVPSGARGILPTCPAAQPYHTILFTDNPAVMHREKHTIISNHGNQAQDQDIQLLNDKKVVARHADPKTANTKPANQALRPKTGVTGSLKQRR